MISDTSSSALTSLEPLNLTKTISQLEPWFVHISEKCEKSPLLRPSLEMGVSLVDENGFSSWLSEAGNLYSPRAFGRVFERREEKISEAMISEFVKRSLKNVEHEVDRERIEFFVRRTLTDYSEKVSIVSNIVNGIVGDVFNEIQENHDRQIISSFVDRILTRFVRRKQLMRIHSQISVITSNWLERFSLKKELEKYMRLEYFEPSFDELFRIKERERNCIGIFSRDLIVHNLESQLDRMEIHQFVVSLLDRFKRKKERIEELEDEERNMMITSERLRAETKKLVVKRTELGLDIKSAEMNFKFRQKENEKVLSERYEENNNMVCQLQKTNLSNQSLANLFQELQEEIDDRTRFQQQETFQSDQLKTKLTKRKEDIQLLTQNLGGLLETRDGLTKSLSFVEEEKSRLKNRLEDQKQEEIELNNENNELENKIIPDLKNQKNEIVLQKRREDLKLKLSPFKTVNYWNQKSKAFDFDEDIQKKKSGCDSPAKYNTFHYWKEPFVSPNSPPGGRHENPFLSFVRKKQQQKDEIKKRKKKKVFSSQFHDDDDDDNEREEDSSDNEFKSQQNEEDKNMKQKTKLEDAIDLKTIKTSSTDPKDDKTKKKRRNSLFLSVDSDDKLYGESEDDWRAVSRHASDIEDQEDEIVIPLPQTILSSLLETEDKEEDKDDDEEEDVIVDDDLEIDSQISLLNTTKELLEDKKQKKSSDDDEEEDEDEEFIVSKLPEFDDEEYFRSRRYEEIGNNYDDDDDDDDNVIIIDQKEEEEEKENIMIDFPVISITNEDDDDDVELDLEDLKEEQDSYEEEKEEIKVGKDEGGEMKEEEEEEKKEEKKKLKDEKEVRLAKSFFEEEAKKKIEEEEIRSEVILSPKKEEETEESKKEEGFIKSDVEEEKKRMKEEEKKKLEEEERCFAEEEERKKKKKKKLEEELIEMEEKNVVEEKKKIDSENKRRREEQEELKEKELRKLIAEKQQQQEEEEMNKKKKKKINWNEGIDDDIISPSKPKIFRRKVLEYSSRDVIQNIQEGVTTLEEISHPIIKEEEKEEEKGTTTPSSVGTPRFVSFSFPDNDDDDVSIERKKKKKDDEEEEKDEEIEEKELEKIIMEKVDLLEKRRQSFQKVIQIVPDIIDTYYQDDYNFIQSKREKEEREALDREAENLSSHIISKIRRRNLKKILATVSSSPYLSENEDEIEEEKEITVRNEIFKYEQKEEEKEKQDDGDDDEIIIEEKKDVIKVEEDVIKELSQLLTSSSSNGSDSQEEEQKQEHPKSLPLPIRPPNIIIPKSSSHITNNDKEEQESESESESEEEDDDDVSFGEELERSESPVRERGRIVDIFEIRKRIQESRSRCGSCPIPPLSSSLMRPKTKQAIKNQKPVSPILRLSVMQNRIRRSSTGSKSRKKELFPETEHHVIIDSNSISPTITSFFDHNKDSHSETTPDIVTTSHDEDDEDDEGDFNDIIRSEEEEEEEVKEENGRRKRRFLYVDTAPTISLTPGSDDEEEEEEEESDEKRKKRLEDEKKKKRGWNFIMRGKATPVLSCESSSPCYSGDDEEEENEEDEEDEEDDRISEEDRFRRRIILPNLRKLRMKRRKSPKCPQQPSSLSIRKKVFGLGRSGQGDLSPGMGRIAPHSTPIFSPMGEDETSSDYLIDFVELNRTLFQGSTNDQSGDENEISSDQEEQEEEEELLINKLFVEEQEEEEEEEEDDDDEEEEEEELDLCISRLFVIEETEETDLYIKQLYIISDHDSEEEEDKIDDDDDDDDLKTTIILDQAKKQEIIIEDDVDVDVEKEEEIEEEDVLMEDKFVSTQKLITIEKSTSTDPKEKVKRVTLFQRRKKKKKKRKRKKKKKTEKEEEEIKEEDMVKALKELQKNYDMFMTKKKNKREMCSYFEYY